MLFYGPVKDAPTCLYVCVCIRMYVCIYIYIRGAWDSLVCIATRFTLSGPGIPYQSLLTRSDRPCFPGYLVLFQGVKLFWHSFDHSRTASAEITERKAIPLLAFCVSVACSWVKVTFTLRLYTVCLQMNGAVSKVNKKFISHLTRAQRTPSAAATVQVSRALPEVRFSCLLRGRGVSFQDGVAAGKGFLCALF